MNYPHRERNDIKIVLMNYYGISDLEREQQISVRIIPLFFVSIEFSYSMTILRYSIVLITSIRKMSLDWMGYELG